MIYVKLVARFLIKILFALKKVKEEEEAWYM
jgi:hypothetical protein